MVKKTGFIEFSRSLPILADASERLTNWNEFHAAMPQSELRSQGARCMNCGIPFCHVGSFDAGWTTGCPLNNLIPEWNDLVSNDKWYEAYQLLAQTNNFPEFTGRVCPAPCESSCVLGINEEPVIIKEIEVSIIDRAFEEGWVKPRIPSHRTGRSVAIVGSGPAGLACADQLNQLGHSVTVFERDDRIGGLLIYGIPNMKLDKGKVLRRIDLLRAEGIEFKTNISVGSDISAGELRRNFDAVALCCGAPKPRDLDIPGRGLSGVYFAMDLLTEATRSLLDGSRPAAMDVRGNHVIVIGGGDTGTDCVATSLRQGCSSLVQFELLPRPVDRDRTHEGWLARVRNFQTDYGQDEATARFGSDPREYAILTKRFVGNEQGKLTGVETVAVSWNTGVLTEIAGSERLWPADKVFLAMGFAGVEDSNVFEQFGARIDARNTIRVNEQKETEAQGVFAAGDCERGQSLVVWAMADGRKAAASINAYLATVAGETLSRAV